VAWIVAINATSTIIVSPINPWFIRAITVLGGLAGLKIGVTIGMVEAAATRHREKARPRATRVMFAALGFFCGAIVGNTVAYLLADVALFWRSDAPVKEVAFPVRSVGSAKGSPYLSIGSEGESDAIGISNRDHDVLTASAPLRRPWRYCVSLRRQANYEAVRLWFPARARRSGPQTVFACPAYAQWW
jgi:MFS family permease